MSDIFATLDFASDFFGQPDRNKQKISRREYISQDVDYYRQGLDSTGIKVSDPERWSDIDDGDEDRKRDIDISQVGVSEGDNESTSDIGNLSSGVDNALSSSSSLGNINASFVDYNTSLQNAGFKDRSQSFLSKQFGISLASMPQSAKEAKEDVKSLNTEKGIQTLATSAAKKAMGLLGVNPIATSLLSGFVTGTRVQDPLGQPSYRPNHAVLGTIMDINFSIQSNNISQSIAAMNANNATGYGGKKSPTGFFGYVNGQVVSRAPLGKTYTGTYNLDINQMVALEAITKGFAPLGYNTTTETGKNSMAVNTGYGRGYDERGYLQTINGGTRAGSMKDVEFTASVYGIDKKDVIDSLKDARSNTNFWGNVIDPDKPTLSQSLAEKSTQKSDKRAGITSTPGSSLGPATGAVGSSGNLGGPTGAGYQSSNTDPSSPDTTNNNSTSGIDGPADDAAASQGMDMTAKGGFIGKKNFALGGRGDAEPAGFIEGPPEQFSDQTTIADDIPLKVKDGTFVINAPAVEYAGSIDIQKMLSEGYEKAMTRDIGVDKNFRIGKIPSREELDIQISRGEVVVPPHVAKVIGYDRLEKINNRGKREVERRQKAGDQEKVQAGQGFAARKGGKFGVKITPVTEDRFFSGWNAIKNKFKGKDGSDRRNKARDKIVEVLKTFAPQEILAFIAMSESSILGDRGAEGTLHSLMNRVGSNIDDFRPLTDIYSAAVKRFPGQGKDKVFQFNGIEITDFRRYLGEMQDPNSYTFKKFNKYVQLAEEVMTGQRKDFTKGSTFFWNPKSSKSKSNFFAKGIASGRLIPTVTIKGPDGMEHQHLKIKGDDVYKRSQLPKDNYIDSKFAQKGGIDTKDSMFAQKDPEFKQLDPKFARKNTTKKVEKDRSSDFFMNFITSHFQDNY